MHGPWVEMSSGVEGVDGELLREVVEDADDIVDLDDVDDER